MYVRGVKRTYTHIFAHNCLNIQWIFQSYLQMLCMLEVSKVAQNKITAVMICMSEVSKESQQRKRHNIHTLYAMYVGGVKRKQKPHTVMKGCS